MPVVLLKSAESPMATRLLSMVFINKASFPIAIFEVPVVLAVPAWYPTNTLELFVRSSLVPAPSPIKTELPVLNISICPFCVMRVLMTLFVLKSRLWASVVPKKLVPFTVPALPVNFQSSAPPLLNELKSTVSVPPASIIFRSVPVKLADVFNSFVVLASASLTSDERFTV